MLENNNHAWILCASRITRAETHYNNMKKPIIAAAAMLAAITASQGAITITSYYPFGESGSLGTGNRPIDVISGLNPTLNIGTGVAQTAPGANAGSTAYLDSSNPANEGWYGHSYTSLPSDNFAFGIYAQASGTGGNVGSLFTIGGDPGAYGLGLNGNGWSAYRVNQAWIGQAEGTSGSFTANTWSHLALVRQNGTTTFYIDGISAGTTTVASVNGTGHFGVQPGGAVWFDGLLDEARIVSFSTTDSTADILTTLQTGAIVPEASSALLGAFGCLALLRRRRA